MHCIFRTGKQVLLYLNSSWYSQSAHKLTILTSVWTLRKNLFFLKESWLRISILILVTRCNVVILLRVIKNGKRKTLTPNIKVHLWHGITNSIKSFRILTIWFKDRSRMLARKPNYRVNKLLDQKSKAKITVPKISLQSSRKNSISQIKTKFTTE